MNFLYFETLWFCMCYEIDYALVEEYLQKMKQKKEEKKLEKPLLISA